MGGVLMTVFVFKNPVQNVFT